MSAAPTRNSAAPPQIPATAQQMLGAYPGPALLVQNGQVAASNPAAGLLLERSPGWWKEVQAWLASPSARRTPHLSRIPSDSSPIVLEWTAVMLDDDILLLGRNITTERNLNELLTDSRDRFRDLAELSADLSYETSIDGVFSYIAGGQALGYQPEELLGRKATELLVRGPAQPTNLFESRAQVEQQNLWLRRKDGSLALVQMSVRPLLNAAGDWRGTRGICRDITAEASRQEALAQVQRRDRLIAHFMKSLREAQEARAALQIAAREITVALNGAGCRIFSLDAVGELQTAVEAGAALPEVVTSYCRRLKDSGEVLDEQMSPNAALIGATTRQGSVLNGSIWVWRPAEKGGWPESDRTLLREVADHLGIVIAQFDYQERLRFLSECDGLTRLLNRRTFVEKLTARLGACTQESALFYVDLDNFKPVNDTHGHQRGDMVIRKLADILRHMTRPGDLAGRMGGDEFVLWLEGVGAEAAEILAQKLVASGAELRNLSAGPDKPLGLSVGVALAPAGSGLRPQQLMEKADAAMYQAKRGGKSTWKVSV